MNAVRRYAEDFFSLFFPQLCSGCGKNLLSNESVICIDCIYHLPYTNFHLHADNPMARQLWGRIPFRTAQAYVHFQKGLRVQSLLHELKYNNKPEVALKLGELYGRSLRDSQSVDDITAIIPVPLHPARKKKRGFNQSEHFARGLASALDVPVNLDLQRGVFTETQTRKTRFLRYENMKEVFVFNPTSGFENRHVLLVDDVLTTGATIEACALELLKVKGLSVSIATIAFAN
jgi:ComF family protein